VPATDGQLANFTKCAERPSRPRAGCGEIGAITIGGTVARVGNSSGNSQRFLEM
jgi:hypothetical protein